MSDSHTMPIKVKLGRQGMLSVFRNSARRMFSSMLKNDNTKNFKIIESTLREGVQLSTAAAFLFVLISVCDELW